MGNLKKFGHINKGGQTKPGSKKGVRGSKKETGKSAPMNLPTADTNTYTGRSTVPGHTGGGQPPLSRGTRG